MSWTSLPVVDVGALTRHDDRDERATPCVDVDDPAAIVASRKVHEAFRDVGFMYVTNHGVPVELQERLDRVSAAFFALPLDEKRRIRMELGGRAWRGWFPLHGELTSGRPDHKEGYYLGTELGESHERVRAGTPLHGPNLFPPEHLVPDLRATILDYMAHVRRLAWTLLSAVAVGLLGREHADYFERRFSSDPTVLFRVFHYPVHEFAADADEWGVREHTDYGFLTILRQDNSGGLQVRNRVNQWVDAPPLDNAFVVNIGDMLQVWTHGIYRANLHRVRNVANHSRFSFPLFFDPGWDCTLEPIDRSLLGADELERTTARNESDESWDGLRMSSLDTSQTYGHYLTAKVGKVFPQLLDTAKIERADIRHRDDTRSNERDK